ncbi:hypothetical protein THII_0396 [Thioploca ingrica]|uniref:Uncharacterized protein n=1 Tax=Thioploca ingrica TaxID=40754 RepID=A0A090AAX6_9GAMM|nr:hypothetical protein THII_0396 [Thioploca ingrica]
MTACEILSHQVFSAEHLLPLFFVDKPVGLFSVEAICSESKSRMGRTPQRETHLLQSHSSVISSIADAGEERLLMGCEIFSTSRALIRSSLAGKGLSESEMAVQIFLRTYRNDFPPEKNRSS